MSGWLLLAAILVAAALGWLIYLDWRAARLRRAGPTPAQNGSRPQVTRRLARREIITDTEFSSETFLPPEERGRTGGGPEPGTGRPTPSPASPWGKVAVPAWEHPLPWSYGETRLTLMVRDPYWLFTYWEITDEAHRAAEEMVGREAWFTARPVLRVHDVTTGSTYDVAVAEEARNWYLNVGQPDRTWYVEIGRLTDTGRFVMLARSNTVHTPRDGPSRVIDPRWPPLGYHGFWPEGMPASPGMALPANPGVPGSLRHEAHHTASPTRMGREGGAGMGRRSGAGTGRRGGAGMGGSDNGR